VAYTPINERIEDMGLGEDAELLLMLLPLIHVAWADDVVHTAEMNYIRGVADASNISAQGQQVLDGWLETTPTGEYVQKGMDLIRELAQRGDVSPDKLQEIIRDSKKVAEASGGLFNTLYTVNPAEKSLIAEIAVLFCAQSIDWDQSGVPWQELEEGLD